MSKNKSAINDLSPDEAEPSASIRTTLFYLLLLTGFFILLEISFFIQCNKAYLGDFTYVSGQIRIPTSIVPGILFFIGAQLFVHFGFCLIVLMAVFYTQYLVKVNSQQLFNYAIILWMVGIGAAMAANQFYFPHSKFSELTSLVLVTQGMTKATALLLSCLFFAAISAGVMGFVVSLRRLPLKVVLLLIGSFVISIWALLNHSRSPLLQMATKAKPNVIIIGIDSLRPDYLGYFGADHPTPTMDQFLDQATVFSEAVTPLARTYPSWMSILTGQHPHQSRIRSNLVKIDSSHFLDSLPAVFKRHGYETVYATDETRFSNIDKQLGFSHIISPPVGLNDFLLGTFNDFPLSNLIVNSPLGRWLFPYSYANRPAFHTYDPDSFIAMMRSELLISHKTPLFLAVHFCLPHSPYLWLDSPNYDLPQARYQASIQRVDQQLKLFMALLKEAQLLNHSVVVLLSDHGEALELHGDRITERESYIGTLSKTGEPPHFYPPSLDHEAVNQSAGHGTDVLGLSQYHTLLAFKLFGMGSQLVGEVPGVVPLSDIKETLFALANIAAPNQHPPAMAAIIRKENTLLPQQHVMIESDFSPASIRTVYPETRDVMLEGVHLYEIDPRTTRLTIKNDMSDKIIRSKQYADIYGSWMLAFYPQNNHFHEPILINLQSGRWTNDMNSVFARHSPMLVMKARMKLFYGVELQDV